MGKIKLNLTSGAIVEKPLINAFSANNNSYVILDNEVNGSMGLPIILVCKLIDNRLVKITDQNEWQIVKEYLKNIIAGGKVELLKVNDNLAADDIYYTQLTLPVPSFDALKKAYQVNDDAGNSQVVAPQAPVNNEPEVTIVNAPIPDVVMPFNQNSEPVNNVETTNVNSNISLQPEVNNPVNIVPPEAPIQPNIPVNSVVGVPSDNVTNTVTQNVMPDVGISPVVENVPNSVIDMNTPMPSFAAESNIKTNIDNDVNHDQGNLIKNPETVSNSRFQEQKEAFMQACENMFDALVQKFEKEITDKK